METRYYILHLRKLWKQKRCDVVSCRRCNDVVAGVPGQVKQRVLAGKQEVTTRVHERLEPRQLP